MYHTWDLENSAIIKIVVLLLTGHVRSAKPASAQPNRMQKRYVQALYLSAGFGDSQTISDLKTDVTDNITKLMLSRSIYPFVRQTEEIRRI